MIRVSGLRFDSLDRGAFRERDEAPKESNELFIMGLKKIFICNCVYHSMSGFFA